MMKAQRFDRRFLAFGIGFPWAVACCFAVVALFFQSGTPGPVALFRPEPGSGLSLPFAAFVPAAAVLTGGVGSVFGVLGAARLSRRWLRRVLMGAAVLSSLLIVSAAAALVIGQRSGAQGRGALGSGFDATVFALGSGAAVALGVVMMFVYQPPPIWGARDEKALAEEQAALNGQPTVKYFLSARSSSFVLLTMMILLLGGLLLLLSAWIALALALLLGLLMASLFGSVKIDGGMVTERYLTVRLAGVLPVVRVPLATLRTVQPTAVDPWQQGGPGFRKQAGRRQFLLRKGSALRLEFGAGDELLLGTPSPEQAEELAGYLRSLTS